MNSGNILSINYDRVIRVEEIELTTSNAGYYDYEYTTATIDGVEYTVFYKYGDNPENYIKPEIIDGVAKTFIQIETKKSYSYTAPACSKFKINYADVDKEGSGRNPNTGVMVRERIGSYISVDLSWDLIPNSDNYNKWYKVLTHLPPSFNVELLMPSGEIETYQMYRGDVSTDLYLFYKDRQLWKGLTTTFIQFDITEYDDKFDPNVNLEDEIIYEGKMYTISKQASIYGDMIIKEVPDYQLQFYIANGWDVQ